MPQGRQSTLLIRQYRELFLSFGMLLIGLAVPFLFMALLACLFGECTVALPFLVTAAISAFPGVLLYLLLRKRELARLDYSEAGVVVVLIWIAASTLGALPFVFALKLPYLHALFETVSGLTTTGLSLVQVEEAPQAILLYRSLLQWLGGLGFAVVMVAAIIGPHAVGLYDVEGHGDKLLPHVKRSAGAIFIIYTVYTMLGVLALWLFKMPLFDAVNHSMCALATGGFSPRMTSIGYYDSLPIELTLLVLMLLGCTGFAVHMLLIQRRFKDFWRHPEPRTLFWSLSLGLVALIWGLKTLGGIAFGQATREALFNGVSAITGTGFGTVDFTAWPDYTLIVLSVLMTLGGGVGSTAGGVKMYRVYLAARSISWELKRKLLPPRATYLPYLWRQGQKYFVSAQHLSEMHLFVLVYLSAWAFGSLILMSYGHSAAYSIFEFASALGTVGLSVGITSPAAPAGLLWTEILGMFLGRLEFFVVLLAGARVMRDSRLISKERSALRKRPT